MNALPMGGRLVAPELPVGELDFVDFIKLYILPLPFLSLHIFFQYGKR